MIRQGGRVGNEWACLFFPTFPLLLITCPLIGSFLSGGFGVEMSWACLFSPPLPFLIWGVWGGDELSMSLLFTPSLPNVGESSGGGTWEWGVRWTCGWGGGGWESFLSPPSPLSRFSVRRLPSVGFFLGIFLGKFPLLLGLRKFSSPGLFLQGLCFFRVFGGFSIMQNVCRDDSFLSFSLLKWSLLKFLYVGLYLFLFPTLGGLPGLSRLT